MTEKRGQIAHLDQNPSNHDPDNLAFLCFDHHDRYDGRTSQSKGLTILEVKRYRTALHEAIERSQHGSAALPVAANPKQRSILEWKGKLVSVHRRQTIEASRRAGHVPRNQRDYRVTDCDEHCVRLHDTASGTNFAIPLEDLKINVDEERLGRLLLIQIV